MSVSKPDVRVSIVQSNYVPWRGYFDLMALSDHFVLYDIVQFTKNDWRNRNLIKTRDGLLWLTVPVGQAGKFGQRIDQVEATDDRWRIKHWRSIEQAYARAPYFSEYRDRFEELYLGSSERRLTRINSAFLGMVAEALGIRTPIASAGDFEELPTDRVDRLVAICSHFDAKEYLSGPAARDYLDERRFAAAGMSVRFMDYSGYPEYPQLHPPFAHGVSAIDLLFNTGRAASSYMLVGNRPAAHLA
jgi:hypothetical protein